MADHSSVPAEVPPPPNARPRDDSRPGRMPVPHLLRMQHEIARIGLHWCHGEDGAAWKLIRSCYQAYGASFVYNLHLTLSEVLAELGERSTGRTYTEEEKAAIFAEGPEEVLAANIRLAVDAMLSLALKSREESEEGFWEVQGLIWNTWEWTDGVTIALLELARTRPGAAGRLHSMEREAARLRGDHALVARRLEKLGPLS